MISLNDFCGMTINVITKGGMADYQPTLVLLDSCAVRSLAGVPGDVDHRVAVQDWILGLGPPPAYLFAVRSGDVEITAGKCLPSGDEFAVILPARAGFQVKSIERPAWWRLEG